MRTGCVGENIERCLVAQVSDCNDVLSGVPQSSLLGPILFVFDTDDSISKILNFVDVRKIYGTVNSVEGIESLRTDLRNLVS